MWVMALKEVNFKLNQKTKNTAWQWYSPFGRWHFAGTISLTNKPLSAFCVSGRERTCKLEDRAAEQNILWF